METTQTIREALGLTQEEVSLLLRVTKSQLAMYETGKRDLPIAAKLKLVAMWQYVQNNEETKLVLHDVKTTEAKMIKIVEQELLVNQHKQLLLERRINRFKNKYQKSLSALKLVEYLETQSSKHEKELTEIIRSKALKGIEKNGLPEQTKWNLKLNALQLHQKKLQKELSRYRE